MKELAVYTVEGGGLVFGDICYSFSMLDASWLADNLIKASNM